MSSAADTYEVYALRYATMRGRRASEVFFRYQLYGVEDRPLGMDCYFWLIRSPSRVVLVDCGWNRERGLGRASGRFSHVAIEQNDPLELLSRLDVPASSVARAELDCWTGPYSDRLAIAHSTAPEDVKAIQDLAHAGRVHVIDDPEELLPGISATPVGGHTPGQMITEVATGSGAVVVLASDAAHYQEEMDHDRPFYVYTDLLATLRTYEHLRGKATQPNTWVVTGHDPVEMDRFERVNADCVDLTKPRDPQGTERV
jgi:hypothetical protein